jgi:HAE1 family hydrophobic/amphiphilic exporter-1
VGLRFGAEAACEEFAGMGLAVFLAIALIYMVLASQFESFIHPFTILLSVPLAITGVIVALFCRAGVRPDSVHRGAPSGGDRG